MAGGPHDGAGREYTLVGLSHKTAPVEVRERLAVASSEMGRLLGELKEVAGVEEAMVVSTCNRVEAYVFGSREVGAGVKSFLAAKAGDLVLPSLYERRGREALQHLFRVCCSLDSMILGEPQILGQVKDAFGAAQEGGSLGGAVTGACQAAFGAAKRVRTETAIGEAPVSMASAAVELARKIFGSLEGRTVLLIGAGKMSELTARHLSSGRSNIVVTNRTFARGEELAAKVGGIARPFEELTALLGRSDIVVSSTAAQRPILTVPMMHTVLKLRHHRPLFLVDLAVPRDIEPGVGKLENVFAYDVDDLEQVVQEGRQNREQEAQQAEQIVREELDAFLRARKLRDSVPVLAELRQRADAIARAEVERTLAVFGTEISEKQKKSIEAMARAIVNKLLHQPTARLREAGKSGPEEVAELAGVVAELFALESGSNPNGAPGEEKGDAD